MSEESMANAKKSGAGTEASGPAGSAPAAAKSAAASDAGSGRKRKSRTPRTPGSTRRRIVKWSMIGFFAACLGATVRFFFPRALFEPKTRFTIGYPNDFGIGVSTRFQQSNRIWVVRDSSRIFAILARCTHLGCTPDWKEAENKFKCPCHGSGFDAEGINFEGPAPKPLARVHVELDGEGQIVVDKARLYESDEWDSSGAYLLT